MRKPDNFIDYIKICTIGLIATIAIISDGIGEIKMNNDSFGLTLLLIGLILLIIIHTSQIIILSRIDKEIIYYVRNRSKLLDKENKNN